MVDDSGQSIFGIPIRQRFEFGLNFDTSFWKYKNNIQQVYCSLPILEFEGGGRSKYLDGVSKVEKYETNISKYEMKNKVSDSKKSIYLYFYLDKTVRIIIIYR